MTDRRTVSDMKHDAIVDSGIPILRRYELPEEVRPSFAIEVLC